MERTGALKREYLTGRLAVLLPGVIAVLSIVTGIGVTVVASTQLLPTVEFGLARVLPPSARAAAGFTGAMTGFLMLLSTLGLRRRLRAAWYSTLVLLPLTGAQGLVQSSPYSLPLVVLSVVALPTVYANRRRFDRELSFSIPQWAAAGALVGTVVYGTVGTYALREHFKNVATPWDALYYTVVTASTVGYGDVTPATNDVLATTFGLSVVVLGTASFALAIGALLGPAIEARFARALGRMSQAQLDLLEDHVLILGYGDLTEPIIDELQTAAVDFVVVTESSDHASALAARDVNVITADPSDEDSLEQAGLEDARAVVAATPNDADDALAVLTARQLRPDVRIVAAATDRENVDKLRRAGADAVISPTVLGGHMLVESALDERDIEQMADRLLGGM